MAIIVQISELEVHDSEGKRIFEDVHFRLHRGEWACIIGPPGSGKSLLLGLICGELRPERGQILVDDRNVLRISPEKLRQLRRRMGVVVAGAGPPRRRTLEGSLIFKLRALEIPKEEALLKALDALEMVELAEQAQRYPDELNPMEQQLFLLALALSHDPVLVLLDDPLRDLPKEDQAHVLKVLERVHLRKRLSILMTATEAGWVERFPVQLYALESQRIRALQPTPVTDREGGSEST